MTMNKKPKSAKKTQANQPRVKIPPHIRDEVLRRCRRQCCMCFGLRKITDVKDGQLAHLDRDRTNPNVDNLAYLCLECHKMYDTKNNRVQGYTPGEVLYYRDQLYRALGHDHIEWTITIRTDRSQYNRVRKVVLDVHSSLLKNCSDVTLNEYPVG